MTQMLSENDVATAAGILQAGGLVAFPTETVYGLGADATNGQAVARVFEAKGRPTFNPLIVHVASLADAQRLAQFDDTALRLAQTFWPGALSLVLPLRADAGLSDLVSAGLPCVAIRMPDHPLALDLLAKIDRPIAAPSANPSGGISPTTAQHVIDGLSGRIDAVLNGGACPVGLESTIFGDGKLLRPGGIPRDALQDCLGVKIPDHDGSAITAPGQMTSHYAPDAALRLNATDAHAGEVLIGFGAVQGDLTLSQTGDVREAAANLFAMLRKADALGGKIAVAPVPTDGLGLAINDRLARAAAPKGDR